VIPVADYRLAAEVMIGEGVEEDQVEDANSNDRGSAFTDYDKVYVSEQEEEVTDSNIEQSSTDKGEGFYFISFQIIYLI
jgi:hypothetical protein